MRSINLVILLYAVLWASALSSPAEVALAPVFGHHMVLQAGMPVPVWGSASIGETVSVRFGTQSKVVQTDASGHWSVTLEPLAPSFEPRVLSVEILGNPSASATRQCTNVLVGEVWLAAGQSNMEWPLVKEAHADTEIPAATNSLLRLLNLSFAGQYFFATPFGSNETARLTADKYYSGAWHPCSPGTAREFSAIAYYFGREVLKGIDVPVGLIHLAVGGSPTEAWIRRGALANDPELRDLTRGNWLTNTALDDWCRQRGGQNLNALINSGLRVPGDDLGPNHPFKPGFLWEAGPARLLPFAVRGVLWYQGESNSLLSRRVAQHKKLFPLLVRDWRAQWNQARLPFLFCQLSSISTNGGYQAQYWPEFRDQQRCFLDAVPDTHLAVTSDLGHPTDVHPRNKRDVGHRLALAALAQVYGHGNEFSGPQIDRAVLRGASVILRFRHSQGLRTRDGRPPNGFELGDVEGVFKLATAVIQDDTVVLTCAAIRTPAFVRYAWQPFPYPPQNLVNAADLPASTFQVTVSR